MTSYHSVSKETSYGCLVLEIKTLNSRFFDLQIKLSDELRIYEPVIRKNDQQVILLSPAAASFDQFPSFEARGQHFCALAAAHVAKRASPPASPDSFGGRHV